MLRTPAALPVSIRPAVQADLSELVGLEQACESSTSREQFEVFPPSPPQETCVSAALCVAFRQARASV